MAKQQTYKEALESALECLEEAEGHTMSAILNIAFAGEYKELEGYMRSEKYWKLNLQCLRKLVMLILILF